MSLTEEKLVADLNVIKLLDKGFQAQWDRVHELHQQQRDFIKETVKETDTETQQKVLTAFTQLFGETCQTLDKYVDATEKLNLMFAEKLNEFQKHTIDRFESLQKQVHLMYTLLVLHDHDGECYLQKLLQDRFIPFPTELKHDTRDFFKPVPPDPPASEVSSEISGQVSI